MAFRRVCFLNAGYCTQWGYLAGRKTRGLVRFHAVFIYLEHAEHGTALIDTGYSPLFLEATRPFPQRLYRWATPLHLDPRGNAWSILESHGLKPERVARIFVSHFHGDHIAGLRHFPRTTFIYRRASHDALLREGAWQQVRQAFLAGLLPGDFTARGEGLVEDVFRPGTGPLSEFRVHDYWGDGDLLLVDLPGHAVGHTGYLLNTADGQIFYVVDASWDIAGMLEGRTLPRLSQAIQHSYEQYVDTQARLRRFAGRGECPLLACHCPGTQEYVWHGQD